MTKEREIGREGFPNFNPEGRFLSTLFVSAFDFPISAEADALRKETLKAVLKETLEEFELKVVNMHFGLEDRKASKYKDIARELESNPREVAQTEKKALQKIKHKPSCEKLLFFLPYSEKSLARLAGFTCRWDLIKAVNPSFDIAKLAPENRPLNKTVFGETITSFEDKISPQARLEILVGIPTRTPFTLLSALENIDTSQVSADTVNQILAVVKKLTEPDSPEEK